MSPSRFTGLLLALALVSACGQSPSSAPPTAAAAVSEAVSTPLPAETVSTTPVAPAADAPAAATTASTELQIDNFADASGWDNYVDKTATVKVSAGPGESGSALLIDYNLTGGTWLGICKRFGKNFKPYQGLRFRYKGEGAANSLEFKLEDADGSTFGTLIPSRSNPAAWTTVELPFSQLKYFWGGDQVLDLNDPKVHFAVSIKDGDSGKTGRIMIEKLEFMN